MKNYTSVAKLYEIYQRHSTVYIDTRKAVKSALFVAVGQKNKGGVHRGNQFAVAALESGQAAYAVINDGQLKEKYKDDERFLLVEDCEKALQDLAKEHRKYLKAPIIAIGGSNGKTTTKELLYNILAQKYKVYSTQGNFNNHLGVPLSLLSIDSSYQMIILEIGANHLGETRFLAEMIAPNYGLVTNCGKDHLGEYGSVANIIKANKELYDILAKTKQTAFVCTNDSLLVEMAKEVENCIFYGQNTALTARIVQRPFLQLELNRGADSILIQSNLFGAFWLDTLLNAAAIGSHFGLSLSAIQKGLEAYQPAALRSQLLSWQGNTILLDCYNANPSSMEVFLKEIQESDFEKPKILLLGEMLELGAYSKEEHQILVNSIDYSLYESVHLVGAAFESIELAPNAKGYHWENTLRVEQWIKKQNFKNKYFFVKGSRGNHLESIFA